MKWDEVNNILHEEQTGGPCVQKLQENTKHGLHFRFFCQFRKFNYNLTIAEAIMKEPSQTKRN